MSTNKTGYFMSLLYPKSIPESWEMELELMDIPMAISPLHDKDRSNVKGQECKKAHYHIIYVAANPVTAHSVRKRIRGASGNRSIAKIQVVGQSMKNMYLYLTHESKGAITKDKCKYVKRDIKPLSNFDIDRHMVFDVENKEGVLNDICDMMNDHGLANIKELRRFAKEHGSDYNLPSMKIINSVLRSHTRLIRLYFDTTYQERKYG